MGLAQVTFATLSFKFVGEATGEILPKQVCILSTFTSDKSPIWKSGD